LTRGLRGILGTSRLSAIVAILVGATILAATARILRPDDGPPAPKVEAARDAARPAVSIVVPADAVSSRNAKFPSVVRMRVGEVIQLRNDTDEGLDIGTFYVPARSTRAYRVLSPGTFTGGCVVHPAGVFTLEVAD
jgi:hypothetical protein